MGYYKHVWEHIKLPINTLYTVLKKSWFGKRSILPRISSCINAISSACRSNNSTNSGNGSENTFENKQSNSDNYWPVLLIFATTNKGKQRDQNKIIVQFTQYLRRCVTNFRHGNGQSNKQCNRHQYCRPQRCQRRNRQFQPTTAKRDGARHRQAEQCVAKQTSQWQYNA